MAQNELLLGLAQAGLTVSAVALALFLLRRTLKKRYPARAVCVIWALLAVRLLFPVQLTLPDPPIQLTPPERTLYVTYHQDETQAAGAAQDGVAQPALPRGAWMTESEFTQSVQVQENWKSAIHVDGVLALVWRTGVLYNVFTLIGVLVGLWIYGIATRRAYLLWTFYVSAAILTVMILWTSMSPLVALIMITAFALVLAASIVPEFSYPAELFPTELRGSGVGLTIAISRFGAGGGTFLLPIVSEQFGIHMALWCCVITLLFGGIICHMWAPETSGRGKK